MKYSNTRHGSTDQFNVLNKSFKRFLVNLKCIQFLSRNYESELALILFSILNQNKMVWQPITVLRFYALILFKTILLFLLNESL